MLISSLCCVGIIAGCGWSSTKNVDLTIWLTDEERSLLQDNRWWSDNESSDNNQEELFNVQPSPQRGGGVYDEYSEKLFQQAVVDKKTLLLHFHREGDPTSDALDNDIIRNKSRIPEDVVIARILIDQQTKLVEQYNVTKPNTIIYLDQNGQEDFRVWLGITTLSYLIEKL